MTKNNKSNIAIMTAHQNDAFNQEMYKGWKQPGVMKPPTNESVYGNSTNRSDTVIAPIKKNRPRVKK